MDHHYRWSKQRTSPPSSSAAPSAPSTSHPQYIPAPLLPQTTYPTYSPSQSSFHPRETLPSHTFPIPVQPALTMQHPLPQLPHHRSTHPQRRMSPSAMQHSPPHRSLHPIRPPADVPQQTAPATTVGLSHHPTIPSTMQPTDPAQSQAQAQAQARAQQLAIHSQQQVQQVQSQQPPQQQQPRLPHLQPQAIAQQRSNMQQPPQMQQPHYHHQQRQHPSHRQQQMDHVVKRVVYEQSAQYHLNPPNQQPGYYPPYSNTQTPGPGPPPSSTRHNAVYASQSLPHEYQRQQSSMALSRDAQVVQPLSQSRIPASHQMHAQPTHPQQMQARQPSKGVTPLPGQPMSLVPMRPQQQQSPQTQDQVQKQSQQPQIPHQIPHASQPTMSASSQRLQQHPDRRPSPSQIHPPSQTAMHMSSAPQTTALHQQPHQLQRAMLQNQPLPSRQRSLSAQHIPPAQQKKTQQSPQPAQQQVQQQATQQQQVAQQQQPTQQGQQQPLHQAHHLSQAQQQAQQHAQAQQVHQHAQHQAQQQAQAHTQAPQQQVQVHQAQQQVQAHTQAQQQVQTLPQAQQPVQVHQTQQQVLPHSQAPQQVQVHPQQPQAHQQSQQQVQTHPQGQQVQVHQQTQQHIQAHQQAQQQLHPQQTHQQVQTVQQAHQVQTVQQMQSQPHEAGQAVPPPHQQVQTTQQSHSQQPVTESVPEQQANVPRPSVGRGEARVIASAGHQRVVMVTEIPADQSGETRQLKVEDALAYLEQVKTQFASEPSVYNNFLDIMKEFKAQSIDTGEVIKRVSTLFEGHRRLILGFNTFLPPGYKIELRDDPQTGCITGYSAPGGVFSALPTGTGAPPQAVPPPPPPLPVDASNGKPIPFQSMQRPQQQAARPNHVQTQSQLPQTEGIYERNPFMTHSHGVAEKAANGALPPIPTGQHTESVDLRAKVPATTPASNDNAAAALAGGLAGSPAAAAVAAGKPIEFNQAVMYVNKIKSRFSEDEAVYKTFLDILQTYQKEQKSISEVFKQVSHLFQDHDDLLNEFSHFLPEASPSVERYAANSRKESPDNSSMQTKQEPQESGHPPAETASDVPVSYSQSNTGKGKERARGIAPGRAKGGKSSSTTPGVVSGISKANNSTARRSSSAADNNKSRRRATTIKKLGGEIKQNAPIATSSAPTSSAQAPDLELEFFEELRSQLGDEGQQNFSEFIKCLSLFSQEIICGDELMRLADGLLNHRKPLIDAFRAFVNQSDPNATQTAVAILKRARNSDAAGQATGLKNTSTPARVNSPAARERIRNLPLPRLAVEGPKTLGAGAKSPKLNPLYKGRPLSEIGRDYGTARDDSKSYAALPSDVGNMQCSGMSPQDRSVLNHVYVCRGDTSMTLLGDDAPRRSSKGKRATGTSQKHGSSLTGKSAQVGSSGLSISSDIPVSPRTVVNGFAKGTLVGVEDQRVELDLLISRTENIIKKLERLVSGDMRVASLTALDLRPVEMIYRDSSADFVDMLKGNPAITAPIVLTRLKQRLSDWISSRKKMEQIWKCKRFSKNRSQDDFPLTWQRSELVQEVMESKAVQENDKDGSCAEKHRRAGDVLQREFVHNDDNRALVVDLLWHILEWEANDVEEAERSVEMLERLYDILQRFAKVEQPLYTDEYLYAYIRLLAAVSERMGYILEHNYDGVAVKQTIEKIKEVLDGTVDMSNYDEYCKETYGDGRRWEYLLCDLPHILKRFGDTALRAPGREMCRELMRVAETMLKENDGAMDQMEVEDKTAGKKETMIEDCKDKGSDQVETLRKAMLIVSEASKELFEVKVKNDVIASEDEEKDVRKAGEKGMKLFFRHIPRASAEQFKRLEIEDESCSTLIDSKFAKYVSRALKRRRIGREMGEFVVKNGLDIRRNEEDDRMEYVTGTEDFMMRKSWKRKRLCAMKKNGEQVEAAVVDATCT